MVFPERQREKTHWFLYILTIFISFVVLVGIIGFLVLSSSFVNANLTFYIYSAIVCLVLGYVTGFVLNRVTHTNKILIIGGAIPSFLCAFICFAVFNIFFILQKQMVALSQNAIAQGGELGAAGASGFSSFFNAPNPTITAILIIVLFNITIIANSIMKDEPKKDFLIYLYFLIVLVIFCVGTYVSINNIVSAIQTLHF